MNSSQQDFIKGEDGITTSETEASVAQRVLDLRSNVLNSLAVDGPRSRILASSPTILPLSSKDCQMHAIGKCVELGSGTEKPVPVIEEQIGDYIEDFKPIVHSMLRTQNVIRRKGIAHIKTQRGL